MNVLRFSRLSTWSAQFVTLSLFAVFTPRALAQTSEVRAVLSTFAGTVSSGSLDGAGADARFHAPAGVAVDAAGIVYVSDTGNGTVRKITPAGVVTTLAGAPGEWGAVDATGTAARFATPLHLAVDGSGTVYVADSANGALRKITAAGEVTTFDLSAARPAINGLGGVAVSADGRTVYFTDRGNNVVRRIVDGGSVTVFAGDPWQAGSVDGTGTAARFYEPTGLALDATGNLYVADSRNHTVRRLTAAGVVSTLAGTAGALGSADGDSITARFYLPRAVAVDAAGNVFVADSGNQTVRRIAAAGANVTTVAGTAEQAGSMLGTGAAARFDLPTALAALADGTLYVADSRNNVVRKITPAGVVTTFAGVAPASTDGTGATARFRAPQAVDCDAAGNLYVADSADSVIRKVTPAGVTTTLAGRANLSGSADGTGAAARFNRPEGILVAADATVYVADTLNHTIRKISAEGTVTTLAGEAGIPGDTNGTGTVAHFRHPRGLAFDPDGNLVVADTDNNMIRRVTPTGEVTTIAGTSAAYGVGARDGTGPTVQFEYPSAVAVNAAGEIFVADAHNAAIRKIDTAGTVSTAYGVFGSFGTSDGDATGVRFRRPMALAFDAAGNLLVADPDAATVRLIAVDGITSTVAGFGDTSGALDGAGPVARLRGPSGLAVAPDGTLYIADTGNSVIRHGTLEWGTPPEFTQQPTKLRDVTPSTYTVEVAATTGVVHYRWQFQPKWGAWTDCATDPRFSGADTDTLAIPGMTPALTDTRIRCLIDNGFSTVVESDLATLWMVGDSSVRITGDSVDIELVVTVGTLAGTPRSQDKWGSSSGPDNGVGTAAKFAGPRGVAIAADGTAYVADSFGGTIRRVLPDGTVTTLAGKAGKEPGEGWGNVDGSGELARFAGPQALAFAPNGDLIVADTDNGTLRRVTVAGVVTTLTDNAGQPYHFNRPRGVAVDGLGTIYVADTGDLTVRKIAADGTVSLLAGRSLVSGAQDGPGATATFGSPVGLALDPTGVLFVVDRGNHAIRRITIDGMVSTFVGLAGTSGSEDGLGTAARFNQPTGIAVDSRGALYVADAGNHVVRMVTPDGTVRTIAGHKPAGTDRGWGYNDGTGASARFWNPWALACDNHGNLLVCDAGNSQIRSVATRVPSSGETLHFTVNTQGNPGGFQWQTQAPNETTWTDIDTGGPYTATGYGDSGQLAVVVDASFDGYRLRCHVSRAYDHTEIDGRSAVIAVGIAPALTTQPVAVNANAGQVAHFTVSATGTPAFFAYRWQRRAGGSGDWADLAESATYRGTRTATLSLPSVGGAMDGDQFRCVVDNYVGAGTTSTVAALTVSGEAYTDFEAWRAGHGVTGGADDVQPGADLTNLVRYAFGLPAQGPVADPVSITSTTGPGDRFLQVRFRRKSAASDIHYVIQASTDLVTWTDFKTIEPGSPVEVLEQDTGALGSVPRRFLRVKIEPRP